MLSVFTHVLTLAVGAVAGVYAWPHIATLYASWKNSRALSDARAVIAKAEADLAALEAAKKVVAAVPKPTPTGAPGSVGPIGMLGPIGATGPAAAA